MSPLLRAAREDDFLAGKYENAVAEVVLQQPINEVFRVLPEVLISNSFTERDDKRLRDGHLGVVHGGPHLVNLVELRVDDASIQLYLVHACK